jgi:hypothetical protein
MIDWPQASSIAEEYVAGASRDLHHGDRFVIMHEHTIEKPYGWIFFYTSKGWLETGEIKFAVAGNSPLLVTRDTGELQVFGTAQPTDWYIEQYERGLS